MLSLMQLVKPKAMFCSPCFNGRVKMPALSYCKVSFWSLLPNYKVLLPYHITSLYIQICTWQFFYRIHRTKAELDIEAERLPQRKQQKGQSKNSFWYCIEMCNIWSLVSGCAFWSPMFNSWYIHILVSLRTSQQLYDSHDFTDFRSLFSIFQAFWEFLPSFLYIPWARKSLKCPLFSKDCLWELKGSLLACFVVEVR